MGSSTLGLENRIPGSMAESILDGEMPLPIFLITHPEARLSESEKQRLAQGLLATGGGERGGEQHESSAGDADDNDDDD